MPSFDDRTRADQSGRDPAARLRRRLRAGPRLEVLETRCLMSGSRGNPTIGQDVLTLVPPAGNPAWVPSGADSDSEYGSRNSGSGATMSPNIPGLPRAAYVIVPETKGPHQTLATAQPLPDLPYFGVVGTTTAGDPIDLFRLTLNAGAAALDFGLVSNPPAATVPLQLQLFDGSGQVLGDWSLSGQAASSLHAGLGSLPAGSTVYFGLTTGNPSGAAGASPALDYQLWVSLQAAPASATAAPGPAANLPSSAIQPLSGSATAPLGSSPLPAATSPGVVPSGGVSQAAATVPPNQGSGVRVAVGSPAMRSARPSEGLLADGDPAPAVASDFNAVVNKEWDERSLTGLTPRPADGVDPTQRSGREPEPDALVVVHGPGGFPLLGAVAIGHHRRSNPAGARDLGDFATPVDLWAGDRPDAVGLAARGLLARMDNPAAAEDLTAPSQTSRARPWRGVPLSIFSALGVATVFTLNAVLSQPIAGFDYLSARLDAGGGSPSGRRLMRFRRPTPVA